MLNKNRSKYRPPGLVFISIFMAALILNMALSEGLAAAAQPPISGSMPVYGYKIINTYPHDRGAFTEGLIYDRGFLYEGTGNLGRSSIRKVDLDTGKVLQQRNLSAMYFGEGVTVWKDVLIQLTWRSGIGFTYNESSFDPIGNFAYRTEGWGITRNSSRLFMSDGTDILHVLDPESMKEVGTIRVRSGGIPVGYINELEYVNGLIYANVWTTNYIAMISPQNGEVTGWIDLSGLLSPEELPRTDVLNGIAYDARDDRLFVTGKFWPRLFQIELVEKKI
ncbi:MAG TPA: glutaminyl-peptide cyclotransferase [Methanotrichaceae archaeon]|nr:glutaminyl-peptide cyclotransferase [Methanotrichaceae archaeon]